MTLMDVSDISRMLAQQINSLVPQLLPGAVKEGHEWRCGSVGGEKGRSLSIRANGPTAGVWADFSDASLKGDVLDLVAAVRFGGDKGKAVAWAKSWLGLDGLDPKRIKAKQAEIKKQSAIDDKRAEEQAEQKRKVAQAIYLSGKPIGGTLAASYLAGRAILLSQLLRVPNSLKFVSSLDYPHSMNDGVVASYPAMVAAITNRDGVHVGTHRTFLQAAAGGHVKKAPVKNAKLCIGGYMGGCISLARGISGKALRDAPAGDKVILCEGIEDGLSLAMWNPDYRVLAAVSVSNLQNIWLPPTITDVIIAADNDPETIMIDGVEKRHPARLAVDTAVQIFFEQGRDVEIIRSPVGKDFNDALMAQSKEAFKAGHDGR